MTLALPDGSRREFEILTVIKENYYGLTNRYSIECSVIIQWQIYLKRDRVRRFPDE